MIKGEDILKTLVELYEAQEQIKITYTTKEREVTHEKSKRLA